MGDEVHSGKMEPTVKAVEAVDAGLGEIYAALRRSGGSWIITADHGNAECMIDPVTKGPHTYHTTNPVPFVLVKLAWSEVIGNVIRRFWPSVKGFPANMASSQAM